MLVGAWGRTKVPCLPVPRFGNGGGWAWVQGKTREGLSTESAAASSAVKSRCQSLSSFCLPPPPTCANQSTLLLWQDLGSLCKAKFSEMQTEPQTRSGNMFRLPFETGPGGKGSQNSPAGQRKRTLLPLALGDFQKCAILVGSGGLAFLLDFPSFPTDPSSPLLLI